MRYDPAHLVGRYGRAGTRLIHAVPRQLVKALCGATPAEHSLGWYFVEGAVITCPRCRRKIDQSRMTDRRMEDLLRNGKCVDVSKFPRDGKYYVLPGPPATSIDYCDATYERWVWSIGRRLSDGVILASLAPDLYANKNFECLWLR